MKYTITNSLGEQVELELSGEQAKAMGIPAHMIIKRTGYERELVGNPYWFINGFDVIETIEDGDGVDFECYDAANYYSSRKVAANLERADRLMRQLRQYAALHGGIPSKKDWDAAFDVDKFCIAYQKDYAYAGDEGIFVENYNREKLVGVVYFLSKEACQRAIEVFHDDLVWYFNEYEAMLYED